ncbi:MAG TPA: putative Ig domain-containing protein [Jatrophihabitans sp.]|nr:putative Ig domain-containing protein [Jatrophihabitans sp.]
MQRCSSFRRLGTAGLALGLALAGQLVALPSAVAGTVLTVSTTADVSADAGACGDVGIVAPRGALSLREATCLADNIGGDVTIEVPAGVYELTNGELRLGRGPGQNITLAGAGAASTVIDAGGLNRVLELDYNLTGGISTSISGVTLRGGSDDTYGGGGIIAGSGYSSSLDSLTISDSTITGNQTDAAGSGGLPGGGVQFIGGSLSIDNSTITGNSSGNSDGSGIYYQALGIAGGEQLSITGSTFTGDSAGTGAGGAVAVDGGSAALHYNRFTGNTAASGSAVSSAGGAAVNATENWWGCNAGPGTTGCDTASGGPTVSPRLVLTASASPLTAVGRMASSTVTATLTQDSAGAVVDPAQLGAFDGLPVSWTDPQPAGATVTPSSSNLSAASATTTYGCGSACGAGHVVATLDHGSATAVIPQAPVVTLDPTDQTVMPGNPVTFTAAASGVPAPTVQWQGSVGRQGADIPGATSTSYTFTPTAADNGRRFWAVFSNAAGTATTAYATLNVISPPSFGGPDHTTFVVGSAGSFYFATAGYPSPTLSRTGAQFPAWLTLTDDGNGTGTLTGTPPAGSAGTYQFTLTATNSVGSASENFTLYVDDSPVITSADHTTFSVGSAGSFAVTTTAGYPTTTGLTESGSLPSGVSFIDNGDGTATLAGTPASGTGGTYPITITATGVGGMAAPSTQSFTLTVLAPPVITSADHATFSVGSAASFTVTTTAGNPGSTTLTKTGTLPSGIAFLDNGDGTATITGTPNAGSGGVYTITITGSNGVAPDATQTFTLTVNTPPQITSADHASFVKGTAAAFTVTTTGAPTPALSETGSLPPGMTFTDNGDGTATVGGTPSTSGTFTFTITAGNGVLPNATQSFTATVNSSPVITSTDHATFAAGTAGSFTVTTTPGNPAATTITETGSLPPGVTFTDNGDGTATLAGTPVAGTGGTYALTFTASNGVPPNATQNFTLTVTELPSITSADHSTFAVGSAGTFTVTTNAGFPASTSITETGSLPSGVTFTDNGDGTATLAGTPAAGTGGIYAVTLTANNGVPPNGTQTYGLTVTELPGITSSDHTTFAVGTAGSFTVTTRAGFPTSTAITETGSLPSGMTFTDNGDGTATLAGTPAAGTGGSYPMTLSAINAAGHTDQAFTLTISASPVITSADHTTFAVGSAGTFTVTSTPGSPAATTITESGALPSGVTFTDNGDGTATLAGTPAAGSGGSYSVTVTASNGVPPNTTQSFTLTVTELPVITSANNATLAEGSAGTFTVTAHAGYPVATTLTEVGSLPSGVTFADNGDGTAILSGTPAAGTGGSYALTLTATNAVGHADRVFTLTVSASPVITSAQQVTFTVGHAGTFTVTTSGGFPTPPALTETGALPSGVTFHDNGDGTATLSGTPTISGTFTLTIKANNGAAPATTQSFTLTVNAPPVFTSPNNTTFMTGQPCPLFSATTTAPPASGTTHITESGKLPSGVTFHDNGDDTAALSGCVSGITASTTFSLTFTATNSVGYSTQKFTLSVEPKSSVPLPKSLPASNGTLQGVPATTTLSQLVTVSGGGYAPGAPITIGYYPGPVTLMTNVGASSTGTFSASVRMSVLGPHTFVASGIGSNGSARYLEAASDTVSAASPALMQASIW